MLDIAAQAFATLFVVIDPIGVAPIFVALTADMAPRDRLRVAVLGGVTAALILTAFGLAGEAILSMLGVGLPAFRIAGGLMLLLLAVDMLLEKRTERRERNAGDSGADDAHDPTVFPYATPLIAGPGAMAAMILLMGEASGDMGAQAVILAVMAALILMVAVLSLAASQVERLLPPMAFKVVTRVMGVLLSALAIQFMLDGLADYGLARVALE